MNRNNLPLVIKQERRVRFQGAASETSARRVDSGDGEIDIESSEDKVHT